MARTDDEGVFSDLAAGMCLPLEQPILMLWAYFDDSGTDRGSPVVTMAGHIATRRLWEQFEKKSKRLFEDLELNEPFHAMDFEDQKGQFKGWKRERRLAFLRHCVANAPSEQNQRLIFANIAVDR